jgi:hypothetical protein
MWDWLITKGNEYSWSYCIAFVVNGPSILGRFVFLSLHDRLLEKSGGNFFLKRMLQSSAIDLTVFNYLAD